MACPLSLKIAASIVVISLLAACARHGPELQKNDPQYPHENPRISNVLKVRITTPKDFAVELQARYSATLLNNDCMTIIGEGGGFPIDLTNELFETPQSNSTDHYYNIPLDRYMQGECGWKFYDVEASVRKGNLKTEKNPFVYSSAALSKNERYFESKNLKGQQFGPIWHCRTTFGRSGSQDLFCDPGSTGDAEINVDKHVGQVDFVILDDDLRN